MANYDKYILSDGTHYISNSGSDERGKYHGGKAGDQTGKEWQLRGWYKRPWTVVLRYPMQAVALKIAQLGIDAALNPKVGYDQYQRYTYWTQLQKAGYDPKAIATACEEDCTAGVNANVKACGELFGIPALRALPKAITSRNMRKEYVKAGFMALTASKYTNGTEYLLPGDILLCETHHAATNITCGKSVRGDWTPERMAGRVLALGDRILSRGMMGSDVEDLQKALLALGYVLPGYGADGDFGAETEAALLEFQRDYKIEVDGIFGPESYRTMAAALAEKRGDPPEEPDPGEGVYPIHGIIPDVSENQGEIDMDEFCCGCDWAIFRARVSGRDDRKFDAWAKEMHERGFPFGVYDFVKLESVKDAERQAQAMWDKCAKWKPTVWFLDTEKRADGVGYKAERTYLKAYVAKLRALGAERVGQYTGDYRWRRAYRSIADLFDVIWIANWGKNKGTYTGWTIKSEAYTDKIYLHQYTSYGYARGQGAPGIRHRIDMNRLTGKVGLEWFTGRKYR